MARLLYRLGRLVAAHAVLVLALWIVVAVGVTLLVGKIGAETNNNVQLPGTGSQSASDLLEAGFPPRQNGSNPIIFHSSSGKVTDAANKAAITDSYTAIKKIPFVNSALSPFDQGGSAQISKDGHTAFISVLLDIGSSELTEDEAQRVMDAAAPGQKAGMEVVGGASIGTVLSPNDTSTSDVIGILAAMLILTFTFGTVVAMGMPIGTAILGLTTALGAIGLLGHLIAVPSIAHTVATMIGLAVGIDYALFLVTRHRSQLREGIEMHESIALAVGTAGTAVVFAGCTVVVALVSLAVAGIPLVSALGYTAALAVATAVLAAITLLPALMALAGKLIDRIALPARLRLSDDPEKMGLWGHWAAAVTRRPWVAVIVAIAVLAPLIYPVSSLRLGQENIGQTDPSTMERKAYDLIASGFGPGFNGPLLIAVALTPAAKADPAVVAQENELKQLQSQLEAEQKEGQEQQASLKAQQASLEKQKTALEQQQASLNQQAAALQAQEASLERQQASLQAQASQLKAQAERLAAQARTLGRTAARQAAQLAAIRATERHVQSQIASATDPKRKARLEARLTRLEASQKLVTARLAKSRAQAKVLAAQARSLAAQARSLQSQANALQSQANALQAQADSLQSQADALQKQADALQKQADALTKQKNDLLALQATAAEQQKQAEALHDQLVKTITKAGGDDRGTDPRLVKLQDGLIATKGDTLVAPPSISSKGLAATFTVIASTAPSAPATADLVRLLRTTVIPENSEKGVTAFVGGSTASNVDLAAEIADRLPLVIATILLLSMLVLLVAFRSVLIPIQAAITNFLTAMAAFGILTVVFQWGWGIDFVGIDTTASSVPIASFVPLMMFAVLFGLSMDYQVFLLSSIDHFRLHGSDDATSVRLGLKASARVIAAAALIMMSVFSSFILNGDPVVKQFGVGLTSAVALAAAMVLLLAPAVLSLTGKWAWWMPRFLERIVPNVDIEGTGLTAPDEAKAD